MRYTEPMAEKVDSIVDRNFDYYSDILQDSKTNTTVERPAHETRKPYKLVSLFSGCGGMDLGFRGDFQFLNKFYERLPFEIIWANDLNKYACETYKQNLGQDIRCGDIWSHIDDLPDTDNVDLVIGGFPCQDISVNGKGKGVAGERSGLYRAMVEVVRRLQPQIFVAENVKGLLMKHNKASLERVLSDFTALGYNVSLKLFNSAEFCVPQSRERVLIFGVRNDLHGFSIPNGMIEKNGWTTAERAISDLEGLEENAVPNHIWSKAKSSAEQGNRRLIADRVGYTIRAECHGNIQFHYKLNRRISMREAARIQSFPDDFIFHARLRETERQIGNAVPPVLAWHIADHIARYLDEIV
ncbi:MAG: DNA cytosine methyltransferase [Sphingomonadales bacterium]|nr:DNA cytosine methyltransferase [Sphingomonadales bacterium]